jgi:hypothetical protein
MVRNRDLGCADNSITFFNQINYFYTLNSPLSQWILGEKWLAGASLGGYFLSNNVATSVMIPEAPEGMKTAR